MKIADYIREKVFRKRLEHHPVLVVYDPDERFRGITASLSSDLVRVIDGSLSTIKAHEEVVNAFRSLAAKEGDGQRLVVYLPIEAPAEKEEMCGDPYAFLAPVGAVFPDGDGDSLISLCRESKPGKEEEINELFRGNTPTFETIDALDGGGSDWPTLKSVLGAESPLEILETFLTADESIRSSLEANDTWVGEMHRLSENVFGVFLKTKGRKWRSLAEEMWRGLLFSEFAFDLPGGLPAELEAVPRAKAGSRDLVFKLCAQLRERRPFQAAYIEQANRVEEELGLYGRMKETADLGQRDTFAFEERSFLRRGVQAILAEDFDAARKVVKLHENSIWLREGNSAESWDLVTKALMLLVKITDFSPLIVENSRSLKDLVLFYTSSAKEVDRLQREFEQAVETALSSDELIEELLGVARKKYRGFIQKLNECFLSLVSQKGWPVPELGANSTLFDQAVAPHLEERRKVAFFMVDALRFELAAELEKELGKSAQTTLKPVAAQLPTVTPFGMASLLPKASERLVFESRSGTLVPVIDGQVTKSPSERMTYLQKVYGDRVEMLHLDELVASKKWKPKNGTNLVVVKTNEIDELGELQPKTALVEIPRQLKKLIAAVNRLRQAGWERIVIGTDHGFLILHEYEAGDVAPKPTGTWALSKDRCLIGSGEGSQHVYRFVPGDLMIPTREEDYVVPRQMVPIVRGKTYFHSGLSLQECVLPLIEVDLSFKGDGVLDAPIVEIGYRKGKTDKVTSRRPSLELHMQAGGLFAQDEGLEILLEAYDSKGRVVGEVITGPNVNPATQGVRLSLGDSITAGLRMDDDFEGAFTVKASNPLTGVVYGSLKLKTAYAV